MTAIHFINRLPSRILGMKSPLELLEKKYPEVKLKTGLPVKIFGCIGYVYSSAHRTDKWSTKGLKCVFVGYSTTQKGYKLYHPITKKYIVSKDVVFDENQFFYKPIRHIQSTPTSDVTNSSDLLGQQSESLDNSPNHNDNQDISPHSIPPLQTSLTEISSPKEVCNLHPSLDHHNPSQKGEETITVEDSEVIVPYPKYYERKKKKQQIEPPHAENGEQRDNVPEKQSECTADNHLAVLEPQSESDKDALPIALRKGIRTCTNSVPYAMVNYLNYNKVSPDCHAFLSAIQEIPIPRNAQEALKNQRWKEAMDEEMRAFLKNHTWDIVLLPEGKKPVGCRWVYTLKCKADGSLERYKARLVAQGYTQTHGIDYQDTFAPVAKMNTIRIIISLAVNLDWPLNQYDIKNAFLHGDLKEEIYMQLPPGYEGNQNEGKVCKLRKALYGLKQSPRAWFGRFTQAMRSVGYKQSNGDHTLFFKHQMGLITILLVYVDDIIITGNNFAEIKRLEDHLASNFQIKHLGHLLKKKTFRTS